MTPKQIRECGAFPISSRARNDAGEDNPVQTANQNYGAILLIIAAAFALDMSRGKL